MTEEKPKRFIDRFTDKAETAIINLFIWGCGIVLAAAVMFVFVGKGQITDVHNESVQRDAEIIGTLDALKEEIKELRKEIEKRPELEGPPDPRRAYKPPDDFRMEQHSLDYLKQRSRKYAE